MGQYAQVGVAVGFEQACAQFGSMVSELSGAAQLPQEGWTHARLEEFVLVAGRELSRLMVQGFFTARAAAEPRVDEVVGSDGVARRCVEPGHHRQLLSVFGEVEVERMAYRGPGASRLYPADAVLNLPVEKHSHGVRRLAAIEAARGSFQDAHEALARSCGISVGKRQVEELSVRAAADVDGFYALRRRHTPRGDEDVLIMSFDGKGVVTIPRDLRDTTKRNAAAKAAAGGSKLTTRLCGGEKRGRKRMAEVGAVYDIVPAVRDPHDVITVPGTEPPEQREPGPTADDKWLTASITDTTREVIAAVFAEAARRDPTHARTWLVLVDGARYQLDAITAEATRRQVNLHILIDFIHVLEYLWKAAWCLHPSADPAAEVWVATHARDLLHGHATTVAAAIDQQATHAQLTPTRRRNLDKAVTYLTSKADYLGYDHALEQGWPIATGVIEGACRHLVKDRMDITGARWSITGAEAILKLRALTTNGDFDAYWDYHLTQEHHRNHQHRYQLAA